MSVRMVQNQFLPSVNFYIALSIVLYVCDRDLGPEVTEISIQHLIISQS